MLIDKKLNTYKDLLFDRPSTDVKYLVRHCLENVDPSKDISVVEELTWFKNREVISFGELLSAYVEINGLTISEFACQIGISMDDVIEIMDDEKLPWEIDINLHKRILSVCSFDKELFVNTIQKQSLNHQNYQAQTQKMSVAARADSSLDEDERKEQLSITMNKLCDERAERRKTAFLKQYQLI
jgi:plasmid maintenance system antidote protein VapI